jgi:hypothetical protein
MSSSIRKDLITLFKKADKLKTVSSIEDRAELLIIEVDMLTKVVAYLRSTLGALYKNENIDADTKEKRVSELLTSILLGGVADKIYSLTNFLALINDEELKELQKDAMSYAT